jgi:hypothetical protein
MTAQTTRESPGLVLVVGLFMIVAPQGVALWSALAHPVVGTAVGSAEVLLAWRLSPTPGSRVLRWLLVMFGVATIAFSLFLWAV